MKGVCPKAVFFTTPFPGPCRTRMSGRGTLRDEETFLESLWETEERLAMRQIAKLSSAATFLKSARESGRIISVSEKVRNTLLGDKKDLRGMPEISRFLGIVIYMLYDDHRPPHFHAEYGEYRITIHINSGVVEGRFPRRALNAVLEWYGLYKEHLLKDWQLAEQHAPLDKIPPLE